MKGLNEEVRSTDRKIVSDQPFRMTVHYAKYSSYKYVLHLPFC